MDQNSRNLTHNGRNRGTHVGNRGAAEHRLDWSEIQARIARAGAALEGLEVTPREVLQQTWDRRAAELARVSAVEDAGERVDLVIVRLSQETYALPVDNITMIRPVGRLTRVPRVPEWVAGMINVRGRVLSAVDLQRFLGLPATSGKPAGAAEPRDLVVVETPQMDVALLVDDVLAVEAIAASRIQHAMALAHGLRPEYVRGVTEYAGGGLAVVLDLAAILADPQLVVHEEML